MTGSVVLSKSKTACWARFVRLDDIALMLLLVAALFGYGTTWTGLSGGQLIAVRMACLIPCVVTAIFQILCSRVTPLGAAILSYSLLRVVAGYFAVNPGNAILQGMLVLLVFTVPKRFADRYGADRAITLVFWAFLAITVPMDLFALATHGDGCLVQESEWVWSSNYIFGDKFTLAYINMFFLGLSIYKLRSRAAIVLLTMFCTFVCGVAHCSTGIAGVLLMMLIYLAYGFLKRLLGSKWCVFGIIMLMATVSVAAMELFQLPVFQSFIVNVLGESSDLTGRLDIYPHLMELWLQRPLFGYGSDGAANLVMMDSIGAPDTQEGLFQILFSNGLIGGALFLSVCVFSMRNVSSLGKCGRGIYAFVIAMAFCSLVEINLSALFLLGLSLVGLMTSDRVEAGGAESVTDKEGISKWGSRRF